MLTVDLTVCGEQAVASAVPYLVRLVQCFRR